MEKLKKFLAEFTGSLGDLATFLPIACGLIMINKVNGTNLFLIAGLFYILSGMYFRIPMPVQPLKATSAVAMAIGASKATISSVALFMAAFMFILTFLKLDKFLARFFTRPIIRGIQLGLAVILIKSSLKLIFSSPDHAHVVVLSNALDLYQAFFILLLPQIPLTLANSVYASHDVARTYFKEKADRITPRALFISLAAGNLISYLTGSIPFCHGSSGITAHYRFGARTGLSNMCIGSIFILVALAFSAHLGWVIKLIPLWCLGLMLAYIGIRHGALISDIIHVPREFFVAIFIGLYTLILGNLAAAFLIGIALKIISDLIFNWRGIYAKARDC